MKMHQPMKLNYDDETETTIKIFSPLRSIAQK